MWRLVKAETLPLTRTIAQTFRDMVPAPNDRVFSDRRAKVYRAEVEAGRWRPCTWAQADCTETGTRYRVNGKHTSHVFAALETIPQGLFVNIETYHCPTLADVARLYGTFDRNIQSRSASDINRAFAATVPELGDVPIRVINACASGIQLYRAGGAVRMSRDVSPADRAETLLDEAPFVVWVSSIVRNSTSNGDGHLARSGVTAAMLATYKRSQRDATTFWTAVRDETGTSPSMPDRQLAKWLGSVAVHSNGLAPRLKSRSADAREMYVRSLHCWNAWRRNQELKLVKYYSEAKVPAVA